MLWICGDAVGSIWWAVMNMLFVVMDAREFADCVSSNMIGICMLRKSASTSFPIGAGSLPVFRIDDMVENSFGYPFTVEYAIGSRFLVLNVMCSSKMHMNLSSVQLFGHASPEYTLSDVVIATSETGSYSFFARFKLKFTEVLRS